MQNAPALDDRQAFKARYQQAGREMKKLHLKHVKKAKLMQIKKMQKLLHTNRKKGYKLIFDQDCPVKKLESVLDTQRQKMCTDGPEVRKVVQSYFTELMHAPQSVQGSTATPPWERTGQEQLDPFVLHQSGGACCQDELNMLQQIDDQDTFANLMGHLAKNKAAGPDGIPNEILQALPVRLKQAVRQLFVIMWLTNHTPDTWKTGKTVLLYKKGNPALQIGRAHV